MNTYIDCFTYLRAPTGHDTTTLVGNVARIASPGVTAGATSIPLVTPTTVLLNEFDQVTLFDGSSSEIAIVSSMTTQGAMSISVQALQYAHAAGTALCSDGSQGSLAAMIIDASAQIEEYCRQPLLYATYSNETLPLRTMRAAVTRDYTLLLRPKRFPVQSVTSATLNIAGQATATLNTANATIDADAQLVQFMPMSATGGTMTAWGVFATPARPTTPGYVLLSYTAGYAYSLLPPAIRQACIWLTSDLLSDRLNPSGAAEVQLGSMHLVTRLRGDTSGRSVLAIRAYQNLDPYAQKPF